jgi:mono/diheme cytochrome c family protein
MTIGFFLVTTMGSSYAQEKWTVPAKFVNMSNPIKNDAAAIKEGKSLWVRHCQSCHGKKGLGDGSKSAQLKTEPGNFTKASFQSQSDGTLFFKTLEGRDDMPSFKKKIPDQEDIWKLVHFMRSLK